MRPLHPDEEAKYDFAFAMFMKWIAELEMRAERMYKQHLLPTHVYIPGTKEGPRLPQEEV